MKNSPIDRARSYLAKVPGAVSGQGGHAATFHAACVLVRGFDLSEIEALPPLAEWNQTCQPPWSEPELRHKLADAAKAHHSKAHGYLLTGTGARSFRLRSTATCSQTTTPQPERPLPDRSGFGPGTGEQLKRLATARPYQCYGLQFAHQRGVLVFGHWRGFECYGITDQSRRVLELRRVDGQPFPPVPGTDLGERKSHALKGSQKRWPVGILEARDFPAIALVEGVPDFLEAHSLAVWEQAFDTGLRGVHCAPVAMLSASPAIAEEALPHFAGKIVRIFPHAERAGLCGAMKWQTQLVKASAAKVDVFDFSPYCCHSGKPIKDLGDWLHVASEHHIADPSLWRLLP